MRAAEPAPIACMLGPTEMAPRLARIRQLTQAHLRSNELAGSTLVLLYDLAAIGEVSQIVELERSCCAFLHFTLAVQESAVQLTITGPGQEAASADWLFSQFLPDQDGAAPSAEGCACSR